MRSRQSVCMLTFAVMATALVFLGFNPVQSRTARPPQRVLDDSPPAFRDQFVPRHPAPFPVAKTPGLYSATEWAAAIDSTWGSGLPWSEKLTVWLHFWDKIDAEFACFNGLDSNVWDSVWNLYYPEIQDTVSRGRFSAILDYSSLVLRETHTWASDSIVHSTALTPGVPLVMVGSAGLSDHFGAGLTPLPDSSALVYKAVPSHPLGLVPGDIVLGYDGVPWKTLYKQLIDAQLPITGNGWGSSESSFAHSWLMAAGNWHLFDTIDIVKYGTGDTVHLATDTLANANMTLWATEQMDIPGVPMPDYWAGQAVSWGIVDGTSIGYIYGLLWGWDAETEFYNAVDSLMNHSTTTGLIIDFRTNFGGNMFLAHPGLELLFKDTLRSIRWNQRCNTSDHFAMCPTPTEDQATIYPDTATYYDKPIAVLVGPGCVSSGDQIALRMAFHPMAKFFGEPTAAAFNSPNINYILYPDFHFWYAQFEPNLFINPGH